jgi:hypothetical protein
MIYYTSPSVGEMTDARLQEGLRLPDLSDPELKQLLRADIVLLLLGRQNQSSTIAADYRLASPAGKLLLSQAVSEVDPGSLGELK